jgi:hypothetical protein
MHTSGFRSNVGGNLPADPEVASKFKASGFFTGFAKPPDELPEAKGMLKTRTSRRVHSEIAADLVRFAEKHASMSRQVAIRSSATLVEAMTNTHNHAGSTARGTFNKRRRGEWPWYAGVYCEDGVAYFSFVDLGVGILRSTHARQFLRLFGGTIEAYGRPKLLKDVFNGAVGSSTCDPGRGNGLPKMKSDADSNGLPRLQVATSSVIGMVSDLDFRVVKSNFHGTLLRWRSNSD